MQRLSTASSILYGVGVLGYSIGIALCITGYRDKGRLEKGSETPQDMRLMDLVEKDSPDNIHVRISDYVLSREHAIFQERESKRWTKVVIPAFDPAGRVTSRPVIVRVYNVRNENQLREFYSKRQLTGLLLQDEYPLLEREEIEKLQPSFPGKDLSEAIVIGVGLDFPSRRWTQVCLIVGTALLAGGVVCVWIVLLHSGRKPDPDRASHRPQGREDGSVLPDANQETPLTHPERPR